jgi:AGZA family xanthine/uracil permease-like MFS transporter
MRVGTWFNLCESGAGALAIVSLFCQLEGGSGSPLVSQSLCDGFSSRTDRCPALPGPDLLQMDRGERFTGDAPYRHFLFMVFFDTVGTLVGVAQQAGFMRDNRLPRARQAFVSDAVGTVAGAALGTSTVTSYIESATGVEQGGRTGLTAVTVAGLFLVALFFSPIIAMLGGYAPVTAPALVLVGAMMLRNVAYLDLSDFTELLPSFLVLTGIPLSYSIADGLALGFISYPLVKVLGGKGGEVRGTSWVIAGALLLYFLFVRPQA